MFKKIIKGGIIKMLDPNKSWAEKYRPKEIGDLILPNDNWKSVVDRWVTDKKIGGNIALFGYGGLGKSTLAKILVNSIISNPSDFKLIKSRSVQEIDTIGEFIRTVPISSPIKIILIEEADRLSSQAQNELKEKYSEQYQDHCSIIITTNYPNAIDEFLLQRFLYKIDFSRLDNQAVFQRLMFILESEDCKVNDTDLKEWIDRNIHLGMRNLINQLQLSSELNSGVIIFDNLTGEGDLEAKIISLVQSILSNFLACRDPKIKFKSYVNPVNSELIGPQWVELVQTTTNNFGVDYRQIFEKIEISVRFLPLKTILARYMEELDSKRYPHLHLLACLGEMMRCVNELTM